MRVGIYTDGLAHLSFGPALDWIAALGGVHEIEVGTGGYSPAPHCAMPALLADAEQRSAWTAEIERRGLSLVALNCSGNPLEVPSHDAILRDTIRLATALGVDRVVCMSGGKPELSGGAWFPGVEEAVEKYWAERVLPYWRDVSAIAARERPTLRLCFELEPGSAAFTVSTVTRLLDLDDAFAVNLDPSHFLWQGVDVSTAIGQLAGRIGFAHGKDTVLAPERVAVDGLLDRTAWRYATVGHGHDAAWWARFVGTLQEAGYDGVISVEHEDDHIAPETGLAESAAVMLQAVAKVRP